MDVKSFLLLNSDETEIARLREKWAFEAELKDKPKVKETVKMKATKNFLERGVEKQVLEIERAERAASESKAGDIQRALDEKHRTLTATFGKLIDEEIATLDNGELHFNLDERGYSIGNEAGIWKLFYDYHNQSALIEGNSGDMYSRLAQTLVRIKRRLAQPSAPTVAVQEITAEMKLRSAIKTFLAAFDELKKVSQ